MNQQVTLTKEQAMDHMRKGGQVFRVVYYDRIFYKIKNGILYGRCNELGSWSQIDGGLKETDELYVAEFDYKCDYELNSKTILIPLPPFSIGTVHPNSQKIIKNPDSEVILEETKQKQIPIPQSIMEQVLNGIGFSRKYPERDDCFHFYIKNEKGDILCDILAHAYYNDLRQHEKWILTILNMEPEHGMEREYVRAFQNPHEILTICIKWAIEKSKLESKHHFKKLLHELIENDLDRKGDL